MREPRDAAPCPLEACLRSFSCKLFRCNPDFGSLAFEFCVVAMKKIAAALSVVCVSQLSSNAFAVDACVELYRNSLYDEFASVKNSLSFKATKEAFCKADVTKIDSRQEADTGASYGVISGYGNSVTTKRR
jgi:hypothetical protein